MNQKRMQPVGLIQCTYDVLRLSFIREEMTFKNSGKSEKHRR